MKNRIMGLIIIGIAALIGFIIYSFNKALTEITNQTCVHGPACPMQQTIAFQTNISIAIMAFVVIIGIYFMFFQKEAKITKKIQTKDYNEILERLTDEEKEIFNKITEAQGTIFQSDLVDKTGFTKVKVTRILDRLEGRGFIERKRRGMTNVVVLKH